jgi:hypothetical protein
MFNPAAPMLPVVKNALEAASRDNHPYKDSGSKAR